MLKTLILMALFVAGCVHTPLETSKFPAIEQNLEKPKPNYSSGSLWQAASSGLTEDMKARRKGDTLTVLISEQSSASKQASTGTSRAASMSAGIPNLLGLETNMTGIKNWMDPSKLVSASTDSKYDGSGSTSRKENLSAIITARVVDVLANGNLLIEGRRNVKVNHEDQVIVLEGTVRPRDISQDNVVNSSLIADARVSYTGNGVISDRQRPGWLLNALDFIWPF